MYRTIISILLYTIAVTAAPQDTVNSDITYVKIQPATDGSLPPKSPYRESRIENLPLTIPGNVSRSVQEKNPAKRESHPERHVKDVNLPITIPGNVSRSVQEKNPAKRESHPERHVKDVSLNNDSRPNKDDHDQADKRWIRSEDTTASYEADTVEPTEGITESVEELIQQTEEYEARTKAPAPRFLSKLSYFQKDNEARSSIATNLVELTGRRKFTSKCRCEKIWNCPKLQITVPRCPNEYFLCC